MYATDGQTDGWSDGRTDGQKQRLMPPSLQAGHNKWNCANQSQVSHHGNISDPPPNSSWSYHAISSAAMADGASYVTGPSVWNSLPDGLRNPVIGGNSFRQSLKTFLFATY